MTPERFSRIRRALDLRQPDLTVLLENVHKPHNFAAILRTADAVGLFEAHAIPSEGGLRTSLVSASGADRWIDVHVHTDAQGAIEHLRSREFRVLAAHPGPNAIDYREVDFTMKTAIVLGQELEGVTAEILTRCDGSILIPMSGLVTSLNVSVAAAVILYEAQRQRLAAGLYDGSRLDPDLYRRTLFEWSYPRLARLCRRRGARYPDIADNGEILGELPR
jgi:tRNA (guanosine-2'-O-)-methyltransferase